MVVVGRYCVVLYQDLQGVLSARSFVGWYNGLPAHKDVIIVSESDVCTCKASVFVFTLTVTVGIVF